MSSRRPTPLSAWLASRRPASTAEELSVASLSGSGLEIGALDRPLPVAPGVHVTYLDRGPASELARSFPEVETSRIVMPDLVGDPADLPVATRSLDFVIASHLIEHLPDPVGALAEWYRVLEPGGRLLLAVPDHRFMFDRLRSPTPLSHLMADHARRARTIDIDHYQDWVDHAELVGDRALARGRALELERRQHPIHAHVWTAEGFLLALLLADGHGFDTPESCGGRAPVRAPRRGSSLPVARWLAVTHRRV